MSIYDELNDLQLDVSKFEETPMTKLEEKQWEKRVKSKLPHKKQSKKWRGKVMGALVVFGIAGFVVQPSLADMPFIGKPIEEYITGNESLNYDTYKTAIGETAENAYGKMTVNEIMVDGDRLLISSTFEPAEGTEFTSENFLLPKTKINGEEVGITNGGQTIEMSDSMYAIYGTIGLENIPQSETVQLEVTYDTLNWDTTLEQPFVFDIEVSQAQLMEETQIIELNKSIVMDDGSEMMIEKVVITPVSVNVYGQSPQATSAPQQTFKIISESGEWLPNEKTPVSEKNEEEFVVRFMPLNLKADSFSIVPYDEIESKVIGTALKVQ
ncbi:DUF4179 domain-containing protein [Planococcus faecalis]|uniref:DUF4179 domain-containing protein n=1 Tax=Planococcus faecalis TaxID=1598147 RepID=A0ABM6ISI1_9BACL|nr:DUF4179 domain-containing protein [Planococcus faecalis]AQU79528.1 hypothetical protein AJGP001_09775 [Planococcus faecalis]OHX51924.1 hypothetical protein BB777_14250 [Planococcus faecalis]